MNNSAEFLLALDVGNTHTVVGVFVGDSLVDSWRIASSSNRSEDELGVVLVRLLDLHGFSPNNIRGAIIASVVPPVTPILERTIVKYLKCKPMLVGPGIRTGIRIFYESPKDVGADRIVNAIAAFERCHSACIVVDFGTATTFDCVARDGSYRGGLIVPGVNISLEALVSRAAKLPRIELEKPAQVIGRNTVESMQAGVYFGYCALVEGIVARMRHEMQSEGPIRVMATGGLSRVFSETDAIDEILPDLTLEGLKILWDRNQ